MLTVAEPWDCPEVLQDELMRLLARLHQQGPLSRDPLLRHCLHQRELLPLLSRRERLTGQFDTLEALIESLESSSRLPSQDRAMWQAWHDMLERTRWQFNWLHFSHFHRRLAARRARYLTRQAQQRQWAEYDEVDDWWLITTAGREALQMQQSSL